MEQPPQGSGLSTKLNRVQEVFGQCRQAHGVIFRIVQSMAEVRTDDTCGSFPTQHTHGSMTLCENGKESN